MSHRPLLARSLQTFAAGVAYAAVSCSSNDSPPSSSESPGGAAAIAGANNAGNGGTASGGSPASSAGAGGALAAAGSGLGGSGMAGTTPQGGVGGQAGMSGGARGGTTSGGGSAGSAGAGGAPESCNHPALTGGTPQCSSNASGKVGNYTWTIWSSGSGGCITPYGSGAAYKATWKESGDFLARVGLQWDESKTYDQYGTIAADFAYAKSGSGGGYSYIGIYGWSNNPLVEYYIVDDWYGGGPPTGGGAKQGSFDVDGGTYDVYTHTQTNQPSIHGNQTFPQFFSVRRTARQCGHISISEHFKKWASLGMKLGKMYEAKILVEVGGGSGSVDFTSASVTSQ